MSWGLGGFLEGLRAGSSVSVGGRVVYPEDGKLKI